MTNLTSELRPDINGKMVTRHVRTDKGAGAAGRAASLKGAAPSLGTQKKVTFKKNWTSFSFEDAYSEDYEPASIEKAMEPNGGGSDTGSKYSGYERTTELAKKLREDIKEAIAAGYLPDGPKYSVKAGSAANVQDLRITVTGLPDSKIYNGMSKDIWGGDVRNLSSFTEGLNSRLETMVNAYNRETSSNGYDDSRPMYYGYVHVKDEATVQWAADQAAQKRRAREDSIQKNLG
jgi:hypothetical protein